MLLCFIAKNRQKSGFAIIILSFCMDVTYPLLSSGGSKGPGGGLGPPLFLDQTKARRAEKGFLEDFPTPPPPHPPHLEVWIQDRWDPLLSFCTVRKWTTWLLRKTYLQTLGHSNGTLKSYTIPTEI